MIDLYASGEFYDAMHAGLGADIPFYVEEAQRAEPPVLELACGTGRVLIPIAQAGVRIWGLDLTSAMLTHGEHKVAALPPEIQRRITLRPGDMRDFELEERFGLVMIPARSFLHLLTVEDQIKALVTIQRHLQPGGRLILNFFQPSIPIIAAHMTPTGRALKHFREWIDPQTGHRVVCWETRAYNAATQIIDETRVFEVVDQDGQVVDRFYRSLMLRWIYRYEFEHLLARTGYEVEALYGDFGRAPFDEKSAEMVWIARRGG
jgi:ubiquinone/menaquinone biosynthesis C-methylase UbiE